MGRQASISLPLSSFYPDFTNRSQRAPMPAAYLQVAVNTNI
jgi:hypothetical protein